MSRSVPRPIEPMNPGNPALKVQVLPSGTQEMQDVRGELPRGRTEDIVDQALLRRAWPSANDVK